MSANGKPEDGEAPISDVERIDAIAKTVGVTSDGVVIHDATPDWSVVVMNDGEVCGRGGDVRTALDQLVRQDRLLSKVVGDHRHEDGDTRCRFCGAKNVIWYTDNALFNLVTGTVGEGVYCLNCFTAKAAHLDLVWKLVPDTARRPLVLGAVSDEDVALVRRAADAIDGEWGIGDGTNPLAVQLHCLAERLAAVRPALTGDIAMKAVVTVDSIGYPRFADMHPCTQCGKSPTCQTAGEGEKEVAVAARCLTHTPWMDAREWQATTSGAPNAAQSSERESK